MIGLGNLPGGHQGWANGVSGDGSVIVGESYLDNGAQAFRWTSSGGMERLWDVLLAGGVDPAASGWTEFYSARGVSLDGNTIVGHGMRNGNFEAFVAVVSIVPEPATIVLGGILLAALLGALSHRSKSRRSRQLWPDATDASGRQSGGRSRLRWAPVGTRPQFTLNQ